VQASLALLLTRVAIAGLHWLFAQIYPLAIAATDWQLAP
jgi:hypothetical protein